MIRSLEGITVEQLHRIVFRLANQCMVRYYLDALGNGSFSHCAIEVWLHESESIRQLDIELEKEGFTYTGGTRIHAGWFSHRWQGVRVKEKG